MKPSSEVTALVVDCGLFVELAVTLSKKYKKVYYHVPWESAFPKLNNAMIGYGLDGIEIVSSIFGNHFDDIDLFIFPDVYFGPLQTYLESIGKIVWGSRMGEEMELARQSMKETMRKVGLPVGNYVVVKGINELRSYLKSHKNQYVKINKWRGTFETFLSKDYNSIEPMLDEIEYNLGAFKNILEFIVEDALPDKVEVGTDGYVIDGKQPSKLLTGIEIKDLGYIGIFKPYKDLPEPLTRFNDKMEPIFKAFGYRGFFSSEVRMGRDKVPYMIDACARAASPPNELYQAFYLNLDEIIWKGANGILVDPEPIAKYGAEVLIHSSWADKNWQPIEFPESIRNHVKLRNAVHINGKYYVVPQSVGLPEIGAVIGWGDSVDSAFEMVKEIADQVSGYSLEIPIESLDTAQAEIDKTEQFGLKIF